MRRLLSLDYVIEHSGLPWLPTEPEKVAAFEALGIERELLPSRLYRGAAGDTRRCFPLYVILDIFSRYVVGWMVADRENSSLAGRLIQQSCLKHGVQPQILTLHSDRGAPMTSNARLSYSPISA